MRRLRTSHNKACFWWHRSIANRHCGSSVTLQFVRCRRKTNDLCVSVSPVPEFIRKRTIDEVATPQFTRWSALRVVRRQQTLNVQYEYIRDYPVLPVSPQVAVGLAVDCRLRSIEHKHRDRAMRWCTILQFWGRVQRRGRPQGRRWWREDRSPTTCRSHFHTRPPPLKSPLQQLRVCKTLAALPEYRRRRKPISAEGTREKERNRARLIAGSATQRITALWDDGVWATNWT